jgi:hypothetical protein
LQTINPELAKEWHPFKNGDLTPDQVAPGTDKMPWWQCEKGHEWQARVSDRHRSTGCPYCAVERNRGTRGSLTLRDAHPDIADEWHPSKNGALTPGKISRGSKKIVWWLCSEGHAWQARVKKRTLAKTGCPYCAGQKPSKENNLAVVDPELAKQWHPSKNGKLKPHQVTPGSKKKVWWVCEKGHEWQVSILNRRRGSRCPYCMRKKPGKEYNFALLHPSEAKQWHPTKNGSLRPDQVTPHTRKKTWWMCEKGHEWMDTVSHRTQGRGCSACSRIRRKKKQSD